MVSAAVSFINVLSCYKFDSIFFVALEKKMKKEYAIVVIVVCI